MLSVFVLETMAGFFVGDGEIVCLLLGESYAVLDGRVVSKCASLKDNGEDVHVLMDDVLREFFLRVEHVFVHSKNAAKSHFAGVVVLAEREVAGAFAPVVVEFVASVTSFHWKC